MTKSYNGDETKVNLLGPGWSDLSRLSGQCDADRRACRSALGLVDERGVEFNERRPLARVLRGRDFAIGAVDQRIGPITSVAGSSSPFIDLTG